jgi:hypothetical protein
VGMTRSSENQNDPEDEVLDVVRPEFNNKFLNEIFTLYRQLSDELLSWFQIWRGTSSLKENLSLAYSL